MEYSKCPVCGAAEGLYHTDNNWMQNDRHMRCRECGDEFTESIVKMRDGTYEKREYEDGRVEYRHHHKTSVLKLIKSNGKDV